MGKLLLYLFLTVNFFCRSQQTLIYNQYTFNRAGGSPAASGTDISQQYNYVMGINRQWVGINGSPKQNFVNFSMTFRPPRSYHYWQNLGVYIDNEESGISNNTSIYASYTFHLLLRKKLVASFGAYGGVRTYFIASGGLDNNDPLIQKTDFRSFVYPDIIPGFRLSSKKFFIDIAARQLTVSRIRNPYSGKKIGGPSKLIPGLFLSYGKVFSVNDYFVFVPSVALNMPVLAAPNLDISGMFYYDSKMGAGLSVRNTNFVTVIYQLRIVQSIAVGLAYSVSINKMRYVAPNNFEVMIGVTPFGMAEKAVGKHSIARCPGLDF